MTQTVEIAATDPVVVRVALRDTVLGSLRRHPVTLITAPPVSGKATLVRQLRDQLTGDLPVQIVENFDRLPAEGQQDMAREIEAGLAHGQRWLLTSDRSIDALFAVPRLRGDINMFDMQDLALDESEIAPFLGSGLAERVPVRLRRALIERTGGWIGAWMVLRALLRQGHAASELARSFSGRDRDLVAYFEQQVMPRLGPDVATLLRDIAPLDDVSEPVVRAATGRTDSAAMMRAAVRDCGFVTDIDRNGDRQRLHRLFRDYLVGAALQDDALRQQALTARFAEGAVARGDWMAAARLYSQAGDTERAIDILRRHADDLITGHGEVATFRQLIAHLPRDADQISTLAAELALGSIFAGDFAGAAAFVEQASGRAAGGNEARARLDAIRISIDFGLERFQLVRREAPRWLDQHPAADPRYRTVVAVALFWSCTAERDSAGAYRALGIARADVAAARAPFLDGWLAIIAATHKFDHGQVDGAAQLLGTATDTGMIRHTVDLVRAAVAFEQGDVARARQLLDTSLQAGVRHSVVETALCGWTTAARLALRDHGLSAALQLLNEAEALMAARHGERARRLVRLARATLMLQAPGDVPTIATRLETELESVCNDQIARHLCPAFVESARLVWARYQLRFGDPRHAISLVQPIQAAALRANRIGCWGLASLIHAGALARRGDANRAMRQAWPAICAMADAGYLVTCP